MRYFHAGMIFRRFTETFEIRDALRFGLLAQGAGVYPLGGFMLNASLLPPLADIYSCLGVLLLGLLLGIRHSTDADHVVAVATIVSRQRSIRHAAMIGMLWGLGHTLTIFVVGSAIILFGVVIPPRLELSLELLVAFMLILLGALNLTGLLPGVARKLTPAVHLPAGPASGRGHSPDKHVRRAEVFLDRMIGRFGLYQILRPLIVGLVHGLAGSAAVALLVLSTIRSPMWGVAYLLVFGAGTIIGMMLMTMAIAAPFAFAGAHFARTSRFLSMASGLASAGFGLFLVHHIGFVGGLFTGQIHWIPQ